jgi:hypothetical protein
MPSDQFVPVTIPLYYEGHMYRSGSRIRVRISASNGDQPIWSFSEADPTGQANVGIGYGAGMPSRLELPVVPGISAPTGLPPCPGLRGEPCRDYLPFENRTASLTPPGTPSAPGTSGTSWTAGSSQGSAVKKKCKKRKRGKKAAARKKCRRRK